jgi:hypothetical protein
MRIRLFLITIGFLTGLTMSALSFGPPGHKLVGDIADHIIDAKNPDLRQKLRPLLGTLTLAQAALLPDIIKGWDRNPNADVFTDFPVPKNIQDQLYSFWEANSEPWDGREGEPRHHVFHYADIPVEENTYKEGRRGRTPWDIVHMIPFCIQVIYGEESENNEYKITKTIAVILLAHYVGDIHQPLHVGAEYFLLDGHSEDGGVPANGDTVKQTVGDDGGNTILLNLEKGHTHGHAKPLKLHGYWDGQAVSAAFQLWKKDIPGDFATALAAKEPAGWAPAAGSNPKTWAEAWANDILPIAREAHRRLDFSELTGSISRGRPVADGTAFPSGDDSEKASREYEEWAGKTVGLSIHKAGWRLAELLRRIVQ